MTLKLTIKTLHIIPLKVNNNLNLIDQNDLNLKSIKEFFCIRKKNTSQVNR